MTLRFFLLAALMTVAALALVVVPLLRRRGATSGPGARALRALDQAHAAGVISAEEYAAKRAALPARATAGAPNRPAFVTVLLVAMLLPLSAIVLYRTVGTPEALDPAVLTAAAPGGEHGMSMDQAVAGLVAKLQQNPDDATGWALLGRAYQAMQRFAESRDALERARRLQPDDRELQVEYAQALALASPEQRIDGESRRLLDEVVAADPGHQRALWLIGISEYQAQRYAEAIAIWERVLPELPAGSNVARSIQDRIAEARRLGNLPAASDTAPAAAASVGSGAAPNGASSSGAATTDAAAAGPRLTVEVSLDPALADRLVPDATLFVFARAAEGPPMPLAIQRLSAGRLPLTVTLDESNGMLPNMKLSMFPTIVVGARVSRSGQAIAQSGDLQTLSAPLAVTRTEPIVLKIDQVVP